MTNNQQKVLLPASTASENTESGVSLHLRWVHGGPLFTKSAIFPLIVWSAFSLKCAAVCSLSGAPSLCLLHPFLLLLLPRSPANKDSNSSSALPTLQVVNFLATLNLPDGLCGPFPRHPGWSCTPWGDEEVHAQALPRWTQYLQMRGRTKWTTLSIPGLLPSKWFFSLTRNASNWS